VATKASGQCDFTDKTPLLSHLVVLIGFGPVYGTYNETTGRKFSVVYYNLTNGVSYGFRAVYMHYLNTPAPARWRMSQYSVASSLISPIAGNCYGGCVNGKCRAGFCACNPGANYAFYSNCSVAANVTAPKFLFTPFTAPRYGSITISWTMNLPQIHIYVFPDSCRNSFQCLPLWGSRFVSGNSATFSLGVPKGTYFVRLFWTSKLYADSEKFSNYRHCL